MIRNGDKLYAFKRDQCLRFLKSGQDTTEWNVQFAKHRWMRAKSIWRRLFSICSHSAGEERTLFLKTTNQKGRPNFWTNGTLAKHTVANRVERPSSQQELADNDRPRLVCKVRRFWEFSSRWLKLRITFGSIFATKMNDLCDSSIFDKDITDGGYRRSIFAEVRNGELTEEPQWQAKWTTPLTPLTSLHRINPANQCQIREMHSWWALAMVSFGRYS